MKMNLALGSAACLLGLAMSFSGPAHAYNPPSHPCNANNIGEVVEIQQGPYRYGQPYRIFQWECEGSYWLLLNTLACDYYGDGCIPL